MPNGLDDVPDWFSWENQGAGVAAADLDGDGSPELVVLMVDAPDGANAGLYRVGRGLDADGAVTGGWGPWQQVPDWPSWENQGAAIAVGDVDGDATPGLVVLAVDNPEGQNRALYRVGRGLDADGAVTGGWGPWQQVPDWFSWENQGAGIAVADLDGDGSPELVVLMVDAPEGQNRALYRVGRGLDADGAVTGGWGPWQQVPDWFSWENQGAGIAVADVDGDGMPELVVLAVDNPQGQNQAFHRVARGLGADGAVSGGWSSWTGVPNWVSWENAGADLSFTSVGGAPALVVLLVDAPPQKNSAGLHVVRLQPDPPTQGRWDVMDFLSEVLGVHTAALPTGKVLFFAGSGNSGQRFRSDDFGDEAAGVWTSSVWDPDAAGGVAPISHPPTLRRPDDSVVDFFCSGHAWLPDGRLLAAGGTLHYPDHHHDGATGFLGVPDVLEFDPGTERWSRRASMQQGRWYPTLVTLGDGRVLATSGLRETPGALNTQLEVYDPVADAWAQLAAPSHATFPGLPLYAHLVLLPDGRLLFSGGRMDDPSPLGPCLLDLTTTPVTVTPVPGLAAPQVRNQSASVLLPPAQHRRVLIIGGGPQDGSAATDSVDLVDLTDPQPAFRSAARLRLPRMHLNAVLLPDRTVLVCGGSLVRENRDQARLQAELYDPASDDWTVAATATVPRLYHSTAVLLPDGRVVTAGGNPHETHAVTWLPPDPDEEQRIEVYSPPYLFRGPRPVITGAPASATHGEVVDVQTPDAARVREASLVRPGITTHAFDSSQRLVDVPITRRDAGALQLTVPEGPSLTPPGPYMLFLVDDDGVPSVASWVRIVPAGG